MSNSPNDIDTLYKNWCNIAKGEIKSIEDYITRAVQFKEDLYGTKKETQHPEFIRKWRQRFGEILAPIKLVVDNLSQDHPKRRDYVALFQLMKTSKGYTTKHTTATRTKITTLQRHQINKYNNNSNFTTTSKTLSDKLKDQES